MKKIGYLLLALFIFFIISFKVSADKPGIPVIITMTDKFYASITRTYKDGLTTFTYKNNLLAMDLTKPQLKDILSQKPGNESSRLTYYETLNIKVSPEEDTPYESLKGKTTFYRANDSGYWVESVELNKDMDDVANVKDLNNNFWPYGFKIQYRTDPEGTFTSTVPTGTDLSNKTLEEQLATLLGIDLTENPDGVVNQYNTLFKFNPLPSGYTYLVRFDFLDEKKDSSPTLNTGSSEDYLTSSLKHLGTEYVTIKYSREEPVAPTISVKEEEETSDFTAISFIILTIVVGIGGVCYFKKFG